MSVESHRVRSKAEAESRKSRATVRFVAAGTMRPSRMRCAHACELAAARYSGEEMINT